MISDSFGDLWWKFGKLILLSEWLWESARRFLEKQEREKLYGPSRQGIPCRRTRTTVRRARDWDYIASSSGSEEEERDSLAARSIILIPEQIPSIIDRKLWPWSHTPQSAEKIQCLIISINRKSRQWANKNKIHPKSSSDLPFQWRLTWTEPIPGERTHNERLQQGLQQRHAIGIMIVIC